MTRPTYATWRTQSAPIPGSSANVKVQTVKERLLAAMASFVLRTSPDGTTF